ncbi:MAG TPA: DUF2721 domain-containing protein, partial [Chthoniobacteraceae bacterium]|nr:DUF2721 domain-containing protein [Chthoniobacteraceae bacterium]
PLLAANPFAVLSLIAAPAILTNAASLLAMSTSNRFLRASERIRALADRLDENRPNEALHDMLLAQAQRIERQAVMLLHGLAAAYVALGSFASASLISIVGAALASSAVHLGFTIAVAAALAAGIVGAGGLVVGCFNLFRATQLSMRNIADEAAFIRFRFAAKKPAPPPAQSV